MFIKGKDVVILDHSNFCFDQLAGTTLDNHDLGTISQNFLLEQSSQQIVKEPTWVELVQEVPMKSCIDHCYTDVKEKISRPNVEGW